MEGVKNQLICVELNRDSARWESGGRRIDEGPDEGSSLSLLSCDIVRQFRVEII